jgi:hypothetical protein
MKFVGSDVAAMTRSVVAAQRMRARIISVREQPSSLAAASISASSRKVIRRLIVVIPWPFPDVPPVCFPVRSCDAAAGEDTSPFDASTGDAIGLCRPPRHQTGC